MPKNSVSVKEFYPTCNQMNRLCSKYSWADTS